MVCLVAFGVAALASRQSSITFVSQKESPFVIRDTATDFVPQQNFIESSSTSGTGFFLIKEKAYGEKVYDAVKAEVISPTVDMIIRCDAPGKFVAWGMDARPVPIAKTEIPQSISSSLKVGELAMESSHTLSPRSADHSSFILTPVKSSYVRVNATVHAWLKLGTQTSQFVDVLTEIAANIDEGKVPATIGSTFKVCDVTFKVDREEAPNFFDGKGCRSLVQLTPDPKNQVFFSVAGDVKAYQSDNPTNHEIGGISSTCSRFTDETRPEKGTAKRVYVSSNLPTKYWGGLNASRHIRLTGYIGHIPTSPKLIP